VKPGDDIVITNRTSLRGARGRVVGISKRTGVFTVQLTEGPINAPAYRAGDRILVMPYEVQLMQERFDV
jgi:hypothetical protein